MRKATFLAVIALFLFANTDVLAQKPKKEKNKKQKETMVLLETSLGDIKIKLYNETPLHRDNFIKLVNEKFYDGVLFHRVIKNFMIQTGDPNSKEALAGTQSEAGASKPLGAGGPGYTIPAEILPDFKHKKGAVAAARMGDQVNPKKESSGSQFYIVHNDNGTPHLDGGYTVFGEVLEGLEVVDKIATVQTAPGDRPVEDVKIISAKIVKK